VRRKSTIHTSIILVALTTFAPLIASAGGVVECNRCPSTVNAAISKGSGLSLVVDLENAQLTAYEVEYDRELRRWRTMRAPIPSQISSAFYRIMEATSIAASFQSSDERSKHNPDSLESASATHTYSDKSKGGLVVTVHPDNPQHSNPAGFTFPNAYKDLNAGDIVLSATSRTRFGRYLAEGLAGAGTSNAAWNSIAFSVQELALSWASKYGAGSIIVIVQWRDGSRTIYKVTTDNVTEAKYVDGESRDALGNKLPDAAITTPTTAPSYVGDYYFGEGDLGRQNQNRWTDSARLYGVHITGASHYGNRMYCSWDGRTIACMLQ
jgi:hypothetical protein